jgi:RecJ-like exonuclease
MKTCQTCKGKGKRYVIFWGWCNCVLCNGTGKIKTIWNDFNDWWSRNDE